VRTGAETTTCFDEIYVYAATFRQDNFEAHLCGRFQHVVCADYLYADHGHHSAVVIVDRVQEAIRRYPSVIAGHGKPSGHETVTPEPRRDPSQQAGEPDELGFDRLQPARLDHQ
jgi:hypothetical protein